jgi:hypothetical protein
MYLKKLLNKNIIIKISIILLYLILRKKMKVQKTFRKIKLLVLFFNFFINFVTSFHFDFSKNGEKCIIEEFFFDTVCNLYNIIL